MASLLPDGGGDGRPSSPDAKNIASPLSHILEDDEIIVPSVVPLSIINPATLLSASISSSSQVSTVSYDVDGESSVGSISNSFTADTSGGASLIESSVDDTVVSLKNSIATISSRIVTLSSANADPATPASNVSMLRGKMVQAVKDVNIFKSATTKALEDEKSPIVSVPSPAVPVVSNFVPSGVCVGMPRGLKLF